MYFLVRDEGEKRPHKEASNVMSDSYRQSYDLDSGMLVGP